MKKLINKSIFFLALSLFIFHSCDDVEIVQLNSDANTSLTLSVSEVILSEENMDENALTISWDTPDFGFDAAPSYTILMDVAGGDFSGAQMFSAGSDNSLDFTHGNLNNKLLGLGLAPAVESVVSIKLMTTLSSVQDFVSEEVFLTVTPYSSLLDLSTNLGVVGSATPGGWGNPDIPDLPFYTTSVADELVAYVTLRDGYVKFRVDNDWSENYGDNGNDGSLEANGSDIPVTAGTYKILVNLSNLSYSMEPFSWGLVGDATSNGWDGPDFKLNYNSYGDDWRTVVTLNDGFVKFRFNNDWTLNYGDSGLDGSMENGGDNIPVEAGNYLVTMNLNTLTYSIQSVDVWGLVGNATANGWDGPNQKFVPDFGINDGFYYINGAELTEGFIKIRQNDAWAVNFGSSDYNADLSTNPLDADGSDIPVTSGTYNIVFDSNSPSISLYKW